MRRLGGQRFAVRGLQSRFYILYSNPVSFSSTISRNADSWTIEQSATATSFPGKLFIKIALSGIFYDRRFSLG